jgi:hypothetical protein
MPAVTQREEPNKALHRTAEDRAILGVTAFTHLGAFRQAAWFASAASERKRSA